MIPVSSALAAVNLVIWLALGGIVGLLTGLVLGRWFRASSRFVGLSIFLGALGSLIGLAVSVLGRMESTETAVVLGALGLTLGSYALSPKVKTRGNDASA
jgi:hypothetical protein